jgi:hypothetical protein
MVRLRVCPCFRLSGYEEFMEPVANRPWDAWHVLNDGKRFIINYVSDGFYNYFKHLLHSPMCREYTENIQALIFPQFSFGSLGWRRQDSTFQHVFTNPKG